MVLASFAMFAIDQAQNGSKQQVAKVGAGLEPTSSASNVNQANPSPKTERQREKMHGQVREAIDDADDFLVSPFTGIVEGGGRWANRGLPTLLALLVYGLGLGFLARFARGRG